MTADPVRDDGAAGGRNHPDLASFLSATGDLAAFARRHDLGAADALLAELLAVLYVSGVFGKQATNDMTDPSTSQAELAPTAKVLKGLG